MAIPTAYRRALCGALSVAFDDDGRLLRAWLSEQPRLRDHRGHMIWMAPAQSLYDQLVSRADTHGQIEELLDVLLAHPALAEAQAQREALLTASGRVPAACWLTPHAMETLHATLQRHTLDLGFHHADQKNASAREVVDRMIRAEPPRWAHNYLDALNTHPDPAPLMAWLQLLDRLQARARCGETIFRTTGNLLRGGGLGGVSQPQAGA